MCMTKTKNNMDSHSYRDVHDKNQKIIWIVICTDTCITKTKNNMDSRSNRDVHDKNQK